MILQTFVLILLGTVIAYNGNKLKDLETIHSWNLLEYEFPSPQDRQEAINNGNLISNAGTPIDVQPSYGGLEQKYILKCFSFFKLPLADGRRRIFTTIPRFLPGIPFSLAVVTNRQGSNGPFIQPFPSYSWHTAHGSNCDNITSAFRIAVC